MQKPKLDYNSFYAAESTLVNPQCTKLPCYANLNLHLSIS